MSTNKSKNKDTNSGTVLAFRRSEKRDPFCCTVFIEPVPKGRPRFVKGRAITPKRTRDFESDLGYCVRAAFREKPYDQEIAITLDFGRKRKSTAPGDLDNMCKAAIDALNGVLWTDDCLITELYASKGYSTKPFIKIRVDPVY